MIFPLVYTGSTCKKLFLASYRFSHWFIQGWVTRNFFLQVSDFWFIQGWVTRNFFLQVSDFPIGLYRVYLQKTFSRKLEIFPLVYTGLSYKKLFLVSKWFSHWFIQGLLARNYFSQVRDFPIGLYRAELQETFSCNLVIFPLVYTGSTCEMCKKLFLAS